MKSLKHDDLYLYFYIHIYIYIYLNIFIEGSLISAEALFSIRALFWVTGIQNDGLFDQNTVELLTYVCDEK